MRKKTKGTELIEAMRDVLAYTKGNFRGARVHKFGQTAIATRPARRGKAKGA
jgi:hypothetical protein